MFRGCCAPYYPCVQFGNVIKNKTCYDNYVENSYKNPEVPKDENLLHVIKMLTEPIFKGLPMCFDDDFPSTNEKLLEYVKPNEYNMTIVNLNYKIDKFTPCTGKIVLLACFSFVSFGLTLLPLFTSGDAAVVEVQDFLDKENENTYKKLGVEWKLNVKTEGNPISWVEIWKIPKENGENEKDSSTSENSV